LVRMMIETRGSLLDVFAIFLIGYKNRRSFGFVFEKIFYGLFRQIEIEF
jgi:hypothetical protein